MRKDFAIFILSHGRPNDQGTLKLLLDGGYTGDWYILCDNVDKTLDEYIKNYGDKVIVFDKEEWAKKTDTIGNHKDLRSVVYARNASMQIARDMGYKYIAQLDDDHSTYTIRYEVEGSLKSWRITQGMDVITDAFVEYLDTTQASVLTFGYGAPYIGGAHGEVRKGLGTSWVYSSFFIDLSKNLKFRGLHVEDYILISEYASKGHPMYSVYDVQMTTVDRGTNAGGLQDLYRASSEYEIAFYAVVHSPGTSKITVDNPTSLAAISPYEKGRVVKVLNEKWRKADVG